LDGKKWNFNVVARKGPESTDPVVIIPLRVPTLDAIDASLGGHITRYFPRSGPGMFIGCNNLFITRVSYTGKPLRTEIPQTSWRRYLVREVMVVTSVTTVPNSSPSYSQVIPSYEGGASRSTDFDDDARALPLDTVSTSTGISFHILQATALLSVYIWT